MSLIPQEMLRKAQQLFHQGKEFADIRDLLVGEGLDMHTAVHATMFAKETYRATPKEQPAASEEDTAGATPQIQSVIALPLVQQNSQSGEDVNQKAQEVFERYSKYLSALFKPNDTVCFISIEHNKQDKSKEKVINKFVRLEDALAPEFFRLLQTINDTPSTVEGNSKPSVYVAMNSYPAHLIGSRVGRTQENVDEIRALYTDVDKDGQATLDKIGASQSVPEPAIVLESSPGKFQGMWPVDGISKEEAKPLLKAMAQDFDTDKNVAETARVLRVPGLRNHKYPEGPDVTVVRMSDKRYSRADFKLNINLTASFERKPEDWLDAPFIHHNIDNQLISFAGHYISAKNIKDPDELYTLLEAKIEKNGCFYEDGVTPFPCDMKRVREIANDKVKTWKTGEEKRKETTIEFTQATAQPVSSNPVRTDTSLSEAVRRAMRTNGPREKRAFDYEGLIPSGVYCLWLGAMKAEKSLFGLRMAMHYACGKDWTSCRNLIGPVEVLYFDSENDGDEVNDRWEELLMEFTSLEQTLIEQNLHIVKGKKLAREEKISIEYDNAALWLKLIELYPNVKVVYLDCWYQLQNIKSADAGAQKSALEMFESYFPNRTLFLLHHTGREDSESLQKKKPMGLRELGPERWSNRVSQSIVVLKKADLIMCQEKRYDIDEEGSRMGEFIDFQVYSRSGTGTPLLTFEPVYGDEHMEYKYRRRMATNLTTSAASLISKVRDKGPWLSKRELVNEVGGGGRQYLLLAELQFKGFLMHDDRGYWFKEDIDGIISDASKNPVALKQAAEFLKRILTQGPMPETLVKQLAKSEGVLLGPPIRYAGCRSYLNKEDGQHYWLMNVRDEDEMTAREIKRLIDANPTATKVRLTELAKCSKWAVEKAIKALGLVKAPGRSGTWGPQGVENAEIGAMAAALGD